MQPGFVAPPRAHEPTSAPAATLGPPFSAPERATPLLPQPRLAQVVCDAQQVEVASARRHPLPHSPRRPPRHQTRARLRRRPPGQLSGTSGPPTAAPAAGVQAERVRRPCHMGNLPRRACVWGRFLRGPDVGERRCRRCRPPRWGRQAWPKGTRGGALIGNLQVPAAWPPPPGWARVWLAGSMRWGPTPATLREAGPLHDLKGRKVDENALKQCPLGSASDGAMNCSSSGRESALRHPSLRTKTQKSADKKVENYPPQRIMPKLAEVGPAVLFTTYRCAKGGLWQTLCNVECFCTLRKFGWANSPGEAATKHSKRIQALHFAMPVSGRTLRIYSKIDQRRRPQNSATIWPMLVETGQNKVAKLTRCGQTY